jgi:hypothetical protein
MLATGYSRVGFPNPSLQTSPRLRQSVLHFGVNNRLSPEKIDLLQQAQADEKLSQLLPFKYFDSTVQSIDLRELQRIVKKGPSGEALAQLLNKICVGKFKQPEQQFEAVKILVNAGANVNAEAMPIGRLTEDWWVRFSSQVKRTPLLSSLFQSTVDFKVVEFLLNAGADPRTKGPRSRNALETVQRIRPQLRMNPDEAIVKRSDQQYNQNLLKLEQLLDKHIAQRNWNEMSLMQKCKTGIRNVFAFIEIGLTQLLGE